MSSNVRTRRTTVSAIMRSEKFSRGVAEVRAGLLPRFDDEDSWEYERGRQFGTIAPRDMSIKLGSKVNPQAIDLFLKWDIQ